MSSVPSPLTPRPITDWQLSKSQMPPVPLKDDSGTVRAWACPRCFRVSMSVACGGADGRKREAEESFERAQECGVCRKCRRLIGCNTFRYQCPECEEAERAAVLERWDKSAPEREAQIAADNQQRSAYHDSLLADLPALIARDWDDEEELATDLMPLVLRRLQTALGEPAAPPPASPRESET